MYVVTMGKYFSEHSSWEKAYEEAKKAQSIHFEPCRISLKRSNTVLWDSSDCAVLNAYESFSREEWESFERCGAKKENKPSVYFDIDGTLGYWYQNARGFVYPDEVLDPNKHYFRTIEPHPFMIDVARTLHEKGYDVCVISAADRYTIKDKWDWLSEHCSFIPPENIFFCPLGADKNNFVKGNAEYSILIDDYKENLKQWKGIPVKAINTINSPDANMTNIMGKSGDALFEQFGAENFLYKNLLEKSVSDITSLLNSIQKEIGGKSKQKNDISR